MKIQSVKKSKSNYSLLLVIFLFICSFSNLFSQTKDTLWTRDVWPLYVINGVFSPDDQFIYATGASDSYGKPPYSVLKYDLQGNLITKIDTIGGIRQFSEDGRFFWNYYGDKYDAITFQKLSSLIDNLNLLYFWPHPNYWKVSINEKNDFGIAVTDQGRMKNEQFRSYFDSNLVIFKPSIAKLTLISSYSTKTFRYYAMDINPSGTEAAFLICNTLRDEKGNNYSDTILIEIWNITNWKKVRTINISKFSTDNPQQLILKYSPDGSVLGYQHDGKLTLYSTTDYSVVWESENLYKENSPFLKDSVYGVNNFTWDKDMNYMYLSANANIILDYGIFKVSNNNNSIEYKYSCYQPRFISLNNAKSMIATNHTSRKLVLLDNTITSASDKIFDKNYQISLTQNQINYISVIQINAPESAVGNYTISNMLGEIMQNPIGINISEGSNQFELNTANFPTGIYFLTLTLSGRTQTVKFAVVR